MSEVAVLPVVDMKTHPLDGARGGSCCPDDIPVVSPDGDIDWNWMPVAADGCWFDPPPVKTADLAEAIQERGNPALGLPKCQLAILAALRCRFQGMSTPALSWRLKMTEAHVEQSANALAATGFVTRDTASIPWYRQWETIQVWKPVVRGPFMTAVPYLPVFKFPVRCPCPDRLPPGFWLLFWSMIDPDSVRFPENEKYASQQMIMGRDYIAREWALKRFSDDTLRYVITLPSCEKGLADRIEEILATREKKGYDDAHFGSNYCRMV